VIPVNINFKNYTYDLSTISIAPNPTDGKLLVENSGIEITGISIYNVSGRMVMQQKEHFSEIDITQLERGVFLLNFETSKGITNRKIIEK
jgi:hypothetical protein